MHIYMYINIYIHTYTSGWCFSRGSLSIVAIFQSRALSWVWSRVDGLKERKNRPPVTVPFSKEREKESKKGDSRLSTWQDSKAESALAIYIYIHKSYFHIFHIWYLCIWYVQPSTAELVLEYMLYIYKSYSCILHVLHIWYIWHVFI